MLRDLRAIVYYLMVDYRFSVTVFFSIMIASLVALLGVSLFLKDTTIYVFISAISLWFVLVSGFNMTRETFPFCVKMGMTRGRYVLGSALFLVLFSIAMSAMVVLIHGLFEVVITSANVTNMMNYSVFNLIPLEPTWFNQLWVVSLVYLFVISIAFLLGSVFYRFGIIGGITTIACLFFVFMLPQPRKGMVNLFGSTEASGLPYPTLLLVSFLFLLPVWFLLRKASTTSARIR